MISENKIKLLILSDLNSPHTIKWVKSLAERNIKIFVFGLSNNDSTIYEGHSNINIFSVKIKASLFAKDDGNFAKLIYLKSLFKLKKVIRDFKPDILHTHYATSYGLLGALSGFHPLIISAWGSDIYDFPKKSLLHKIIIKFILSRADKILSTSNVMADEIKKYSNKNITITPFGIDLNKLKPMPVESIFKQDDFVIGTIKSLEIIYGIDLLIKAFKIVKEKFPDLHLKLLIVGKGSAEKSLKQLVTDLNLTSCVVFTGFVKHSDIPIYHNMIDIFVALSLQESFGVAVLEANACEKPVVVSNVAGFLEIVENGYNGLIVPVGDIDKAVEAISKLIEDIELRKILGKNGRERVKKYYNWTNNIQTMIGMYQGLL